MAGPSLKKRSREESGKKPGPRPSKRYKKQREYHSSDSEDVEHDAPPNLLGSDDEDIQDAVVDDGAPSSPQSASGSSSESGSAKSTRITKLTRPKARRREKTTEALEPSRDSSAEEEEDDEDDGNDSLDDSDANGERPSRKSKRNDETAFATSIAKILTSSKLPRSKRADPIVARSAMSQAAGQQAADAALEAKARRRLRQEKRLALEKGRVRDVLVASTTRTLNMQTGAVEETLEEGGETTVDIMETERRLRKVCAVLVRVLSPPWVDVDLFLCAAGCTTRCR